MAESAPRNRLDFMSVKPSWDTYRWACSDLLHLSLAFKKNNNKLVYETSVFPPVCKVWFWNPFLLIRGLLSGSPSFCVVHHPWFLWNRNIMYSPRQLEAVRVNTGRCDLTVSPKGPCFGRAPLKTKHNEMSVLDEAAKPWSKYYPDLFSVCQQSCFVCWSRRRDLRVVRNTAVFFLRPWSAPGPGFHDETCSKATAFRSAWNRRMENLPQRDCPKTQERPSVGSNQIHATVKASSGGPWLPKGDPGIPRAGGGVGGWKGGPFFWHEQEGRRE